MYIATLPPLEVVGAAGGGGGGGGGGIDRREEGGSGSLIQLVARFESLSRWCFGFCLYLQWNSSAHSNSFLLYSSSSSKVASHDINLILYASHLFYSFRSTVIAAAINVPSQKED